MLTQDTAFTHKCPVLSTVPGYHASSINTEWLPGWFQVSSITIFIFTIHISFYKVTVPSSGASQGELVVKNLSASVGNIRHADSIPGLGKIPCEGNGNPLQYSCLENSMDRGTQWVTVHGVARVGHDLATKPPRVSRRTSTWSPPQSKLGQNCKLKVSF